MAIDFGVDDPEVFYARGKAYWALALAGPGDPDQEGVKQALGDISEAIVRDPGESERYFTRGVIYSWEGYELDLAIEDLSVAIDLKLKTNAKSHLVSMYHLRNMVYRTQSQFDLAVEDATDIMRLLPDESWPVRCRAITHLEWGKPEQAIEDLNEAIRLGQQGESELLERGRGYAAMGDYDKAITDYESYLQFDPDDPEIYLRRGIARAALGNHMSAIEDYDLIVGPDSGDTRQAYLWEAAECYHQRGNSFAALGDYDQAVRDYTSALDLGQYLGQKELVSVYVMRGGAFRTLGLDAESTSDLASAQRLQGYKASN